MKRSSVLLLLLLVAALGLAACSASAEPTPPPLPDAPASNEIIVEGRLVPIQDVTLAFAVRGPVTEILVQEGQTVRRGDPLVRLGNRAQAEAALAAAQAEQLAAQQAYDAFLRQAEAARARAWQNYMQAQAERARAEAAWNALDEQALKDDIEAALAEVRTREQDLQDAQDTFARYQDLDANTPARQQAKDDLDQAKRDYDAAVHDWEAAQRALDEPQAALQAARAAEAEAQRLYEDMVNNGYDSEQKALLEARLQAAQAQVAAAEETLAQYELTAPFDGVVARLDLTVGQWVGPETPAVQLADFSAWRIETTDLTELEVVHLQPGQTVRLTPDALPDLTLEGTVEEISPAFTMRSNDVLYRVRIRLPQELDPRLRWGMTFEVAIPLASGP